MSDSIIKTKDNDEFLNFLNKIDCKIVYQDNPIAKDIILEIIKYRVDLGEFDFEVIMNDLISINSNLFNEIADKGIKCGVFKINVFDDYDDELMLLSEDISQWYFKYTDELCILENLVFEVVSKYQINLFVTKSSIFNYPIFIRRFSKSNSLLEGLIADDSILIQCCSAQQLMFPDLNEEISSFKYGSKNVLTYAEGDFDIKPTKRIG